MKSNTNFSLILGSLLAGLMLTLSPSKVLADTYYVSPSGNNNNPGTEISPWQTIQRAMDKMLTGDTTYVRGGTYTSATGDFKNSGVTIKNYPNEQVVITTTGGTFFNCWTTASNGAKTDIKIIGSDVTPTTLSNGVVSKKGIVLLDAPGSQKKGFHPEAGCDSWEIAGLDFIDTGDAIFTRKKNNGTSTNQADWGSDKWYVHDNRVYGYYRETGMQFNGNENVVVNNEIMKVTPQLNTTFGCYLLNILGHGNTVTGNKLIGTGGSECGGILFEWSQSDANTIENNTISGVKNGIEIQGGDNNIIKNNNIDANNSGISINSYPEGTTSWPCSDYANSWDQYVAPLIPPENSSHPDYPYYYPYGECQSYGTQVIGNTIRGGVYGVVFGSYVPKIGTTTVANNTINAPSGKSICNKENNCGALPSNVITTVGASVNPSPSPSPSPSPKLVVGDATGEGDVNLFDYSVLVNNYGKAMTNGFADADFNLDQKVDGQDYILWLNNYN